MPRHKKVTKKDKDVFAWVKSVDPTGRKRRPKYFPIAEMLRDNPGRIALIDNELEGGAASSRVVSLKAAAKAVEPNGTWKFPIRKNLQTGLYSVFGVFAE